MFCSPHRARHLLLPLVALALCTLFATPTPVAAKKLSPLATTPNWSELDNYQNSITKQDFMDALHQVYANAHITKPYFIFRQDSVDILISQDLSQAQEEKTYFSLKFKADQADQENPDSEPSSFQAYWRKGSDLPAAPKRRILQDLNICIDPGHIGGKYAKMEERWFQIGSMEPIIEGDLTLYTAQRLQQALTALGANVTLTRQKSSPITRKQPKDFLLPADTFLRGLGIPEIYKDYRGPTDPNKLFSVRWQSEKFFYRISEIRTRSNLVNLEIKPDLVLALHFNAEAWGDPTKPDFVPRNHLHLLINGTYSLGELSYDDIRFELCQRLLQGIHLEETALGQSLATSLAYSTGLPAYVYTGNNAKRTTPNRYLYARNLLANRLYMCPVLYFEPFVMNNKEVSERLLLGDYHGKTLYRGKLVESLYRQYIDGIVEGLTEHYQSHRAIAE